MISKMFKDEQILDIKFRVQIIAEINHKENVDRKRREAAKWEIWRDMIQPHVMAIVKTQGFKDETLAVMAARCTDINIFKKVVSKKARSYTKGVNRTITGPENKKASEDLETLCEITQLTNNMKRLDRYRHAARNAIAYIYPEKIEYVDEEANQKAEKYTVKIKPLFPHLYDIIPDGSDHEKPRCLIISPFVDQAATGAMVSLNGGDGRNVSQPLYHRDGYDQTIANAPRDSGGAPSKRQYIWWTASNHFTTDDKGQIIPGLSPTDQSNPIKMLPMVNFCTDQDGEFWAQGGDDLVNGTKLINLKLTDMESILHMQGWGQLVITGSNITKKEFGVGPQVALILETGDEDKANADAKLLTHDPQTDNHLKSTQAYCALLLTTNNLSPKTVAGELNASTAASAIAMMVEDAEVTDDVSEDQEYYGCKEKEVLETVCAWVEAYRGTNQLLPELQGTDKFDPDLMQTKYHNQEQVITEADKLNNFKLREALGLNTRVEMIMRDNPGMSKEDAEKKLLEILAERVKIAAIDPTYLVSGALAGTGAGIAASEAQPTDLNLPKPQAPQAQPGAPAAANP
jgi:hypothetical protein